MTSATSQGDFDVLGFAIETLMASCQKITDSAADSVVTAGQFKEFAADIHGVLFVLHHQAQAVAAAFASQELLTLQQTELNDMFIDHVRAHGV